MAYSLEQQLVDPSQIEKALQKIWDELAKEKKTRASLFNLIVVSKLSKRVDYFRGVVQKVVEKFPCRILFITEDLDSSSSYLKTAVSVVFPREDVQIACDMIDIGASGKDVEIVPFLILPHLLPDLPTYLLWGEDPCKEHLIFDPLINIATRVIFDSEEAQNFPSFSKKILSVQKEHNREVGDLNWARTEGWRDLLSSTFDSPERISELSNPKKLSLVYNKQESLFFSHLKIQTTYILSWLAARLKWNCKEIELNIKTDSWDHLPPGALIASTFLSKNGFSFEAMRDKKTVQQINIQISSQDKCYLPYPFLLEQMMVGQSLVKEICTKGTSLHFLETLQNLQTCLY